MVKPKKEFFWLALVIFLAAVLQITINLIKTLINKDLVDFLVYWQALNNFLAGKDVYQFFYSFPLDKIPFNYPPSALLILLPFKIFPIKIAEIIWLVLSFFSLWFSLWVVKILTKSKISWPHFLLVLALFTQTFPVKFTLILGQVNLIVLGLFMAAIYLRQKFFKQSIICLTLASGIKLFPLFSLAIFLIWKKYVYVFGVLLIFIFLNFLPGISLFKEYYFQVLPGLSQISDQPNFYDQSVAALLTRLHLNPLISPIIFFALFVLLLIKVKQKKFSFIEPFLMICALFSIFGPFSWQHHLVFSYPLILYLYLKNLNQKNLLSKIFFFLLWLAFAFHFKSETNPLLSNPIIASYRTIIILLILAYQFFNYYEY